MPDEQEAKKLRERSLLRGLLFYSREPGNVLYTAIPTSRQLILGELAESALEVIGADFRRIRPAPIGRISAPNYERETWETFQRESASARYLQRLPSGLFATISGLLEFKTRQSRNPDETGKEEPWPNLYQHFIGDETEEGLCPRTGADYFNFDAKEWLDIVTNAMPASFDETEIRRARVVSLKLRNKIFRDFLRLNETCDSFRSI